MRRRRRLEHRQKRPKLNRVQRSRGVRCSVVPHTRSAAFQIRTDHGNNKRKPAVIELGSEPNAAVFRRAMTRTARNCGATVEGGLKWMYLAHSHFCWPSFVPYMRL